MTLDLERAAKTMHPSAFRGQMAVNFNAEQLTLALRALETLSPEVVETMCHAMCHVNNVDPNEMVAIFHPAPRRTLHHHRWEIYRDAALAAHRAMIKAVIGEAP